MPYATDYVAQRPTSKLAVASMVVSLVMCCPFVTSITGLVMSLFALSAVKKNNLRGRGFALAGLWVGLAGVVLWMVFGGVGLSIYLNGRQISQSTAVPFFEAVMAGDDAKAMSLAASNLTQPELAKVRDHATSNYGNYISLVMLGVNINTNAGVTVYRITYIGQFSRGTANVVITLTKTSAGTYQVTSCRVLP